MQDIGAFSLEAAARVWRCVLDWEKMKTEKKDVVDIPLVAPIYVKNTGSVTVPAWGCMQVVGTDTIDNAVIFQIDRPLTHNKPKVFLLNGPKEIVAGDYGTAQSGLKMRAVKDSTTMTAGMRLGPVASSFQLGKGCLFSYFGADAVTTDCIVVLRHETPIHATAGGSGIAGNSSATVTSRYFDGTQWQAGSITYTAYNSTATAIAANAKLILFPVDGVWSAVEVCP